MSLEFPGLTRALTW